MKIPLFKMYWDEEDINAVTKVIRRGAYWALGPEIEEFENEIKNYVGTDYCITLNSGTSALHALFLAYGIRKDDEVIIPSFSFISTANSVLFVDAKPKFTDIEENTFGLDPMMVTKNISSKTKAIVPMDYGGLSCDIFKIKQIANSFPVGKTGVTEFGSKGLGYPDFNNEFDLELEYDENLFTTYNIMYFIKLMLVKVNGNIKKELVDYRTKKEKIVKRKKYTIFLK